VSETRSGTDPMAAEFDDLPGWTADAAARLGTAHAVPAACRGSASPAALDWLSRRCALRAGAVLVDVGGGMGGPAAHAREQYAVRPLVVEPMSGACRAARRMFGLPTVVGTGSALPVPSGAADAVWCLGVLCTTTAKAAVLGEIRRVLAPGGVAGLLVFTVDGPIDEVPEGNAFPTRDELDRLLTAARLVTAGSTPLAELPPPPREWTERITRVEQLVEAEHGRDEAWRVAQQQEGRLADLLRSGQVSGTLLAVRPV